MDQPTQDIAPEGAQATAAPDGGTEIELSFLFKGIPTVLRRVVPDDKVVFALDKLAGKVLDHPDFALPAPPTVAAAGSASAEDPSTLMCPYHGKLSPSEKVPGQWYCKSKAGTGYCKTTWTAETGLVPKL